MRRAAFLSMCLILVAACGGPKTSSGVSYASVSKGDSRRQCERSLESRIDFLERELDKRALQRAVGSCCKEAERKAGDVSGAQRAYAWYNFRLESEDMTAPEKSSAITIRDALRDELNQTSGAALAATQISSRAGMCLVQRAREGS